MKPLERVYAAGIVILLIVCGIMFLDLRASQRRSEYLNKELTKLVQAGYFHECQSTNQTKPNP